MIIILSIITVAGVLTIIGIKYASDLLIASGVAVGAIFLFACLMVIIGEQITTISNIQEYKATRQTVETARKNGNLLENAAIQRSIIETNRWLEQRKYWNSTIFDLWIPDEVESLKPLE